MMKYRGLILVMVLMGSTAASTAAGPAPAETTGGWKKFAGNPVMGGKYGTCFDVSVLHEGDTYRMWLSWRPKGSVALVESKDGLHWSEPPRIVLAPNAKTGWEDDINRPVVIKRGDVYHMWYSAFNATGSSIGYATSRDGVAWKRMSDKPVMSPEKPWEKICLMCPHVLWDEQAGIYKMWYSAGERREPNAMGYATSPDGMTWTKYEANPIFVPDPKSDWEKNRTTACQVIRLGEWYVMFYIGFRDPYTAQIGLARSKDGITAWQRHPANPIVRVGGKFEWDEHACYKPYAVYDGRKWLLWYNGRRMDLEQIGVVMHEGEDLGFDEPAAARRAQISWPDQIFNRAPLQPKPYAELPLGTIRPEGWLREELQRMAGGMTGHLDEWYPEVCGDRNAWLGGDGDTWERGPYWIDGLYPLARLLDDKGLQAKAQKWVDWTLAHQREDGYIGPVELKKEARTRLPPFGAQIVKPDDWWPRMVMLKILQQHYDATGDQRVVTVLDKYFRYQLKTLPTAPLHDPGNPKSGSYWAAQRGADNLMVVLWFYNLTGEKYLLDLADLIQKQTIPLTEWLENGKVLKLQGQGKPGAENTEVCPFHGVNLAQAMKTPLIEFQRDGSPRHLAATRKGFEDIRAYHGQPYGLYGADEHMHGTGLDRGSELCSAVEMMFSLEKMLEISGEAEFADKLEQIAFNVLPTQISDDQRTRQYFSQANQVICSVGDCGFYDNHGGKDQVFGLLNGYPCCTCNLHQGWPKFAQHLWMAAADGGLAALAYAPSRVTATVANGQKLTIREETFYPFEETVRFTIETTGVVEFPLHLRIPGWCRAAKLSANGMADPQPRAGSIAVIRRAWQNGDVVELNLPMTIRKCEWDQHSMAIQRGPLLYALRVEETWSDAKPADPASEPAGKMDRGIRECRPASPWNYALLESRLKNLEQGFEVVRSADAGKKYPWNLAGAPLELRTTAVRLPDWTTTRNHAGCPPPSPSAMPASAAQETIRLIPYGCTTLRISGFPWISDARHF